MEATHTLLFSCDTCKLPPQSNWPVHRQQSCPLCTAKAQDVPPLRRLGVRGSVAAHQRESRGRGEPCVCVYESRVYAAR